MVNDINQDLLVIGKEDGEILFSIKKGEAFNLRSEKQARNDKSWSKKIKIKGTFVKTMDIESRFLESCKDDPQLYYAANIMKKYLKPNYNLLVKNGKKFKIQDLAEELGVVRQTASTYIKRLKDMNIVAEINTSMGKLYALNPNIYCRGEEVPEMVLKAFDKPIKE